MFALLDSRSAPIRASAVEIELAYMNNDNPISKGSIEAIFRQWPSGPGGVFTADIDFSDAGTWVADLTPKDGPAAGELARMVLPVQEQSSTPAIGSSPPATVNRTAKDVPSLEELTSDINPDPDLYGMTIAKALDAGKPLLVTFATPAFCSSATCGPQVDVVKEIKDSYKGQANFIHVEIYSNPREMRSDPSQGVVAPAVDEWGLPSEPWTFIMDAEGHVAAKFEGFASLEELADALTSVL